MIEVKRRDHGADQRQTVRFGDCVQMIFCNDVAGAGHILNDETGITRDMFAHVVDDQSGPEVIKISRWCADDDLDRFTLIEWRLRVRREISEHHTE